MLFTHLVYPLSSNNIIRLALLEWSYRFFVVYQHYILDKNLESLQPVWNRYDSHYWHVFILWHVYGTCVNTFKPRQNIFLSKCISWHSLCVFWLIEIPLNLVPRDSISNNSTFTRVMTWHRMGLVTQFIAAYRRHWFVLSISQDSCAMK